MLGMSAEATQELVEAKHPDEVAALQPESERSKKQQSSAAAWTLLLSEDKHLRDKLTAATEWTPEQAPCKLEELRVRLANPLYIQSLKLIQECKQSVQLLQLKDVSDEKDVAALECLCRNLWFVEVHEMSVETYDRFAKALRRTAA